MEIKEVNLRKLKKKKKNSEDYKIEKISESSHCIIKYGMVFESCIELISLYLLDHK